MFFEFKLQRKAALVKVSNDLSAKTEYLTVNCWLYSWDVMCFETGLHEFALLWANKQRKATVKILSCIVNVFWCMKKFSCGSLVADNMSRIISRRIMGRRIIGRWVIGRGSPVAGSSVVGSSVMEPNISLFLIFWWWVQKYTKTLSNYKRCHRRWI